ARAGGSFRRNVRGRGRQKSSGLDLRRRRRAARLRRDEQSNHRGNRAEARRRAQSFPVVSRSQTSCHAGGRSETRQFVSPAESLPPGNNLFVFCVFTE